MAHQADQRIALEIGERPKQVSAARQMLMVNLPPLLTGWPLGRQDQMRSRDGG
jgi:hypothetical protein